MKKVLVLIIFLIITALTNLFSAKIYVANLNIYKTDINVDLSKEESKSTSALFKAIQKKDDVGLLNIFSVANSITYSDKITKSTIEASELCELLHIDYLLYGFIEKTDKYFNAEVRLFENDTKRDRKTFYVKLESSSKIDEVINELADKIKTYLYYMFGVSEYHKERKMGFGGIGIYNSAGYWIPMGDWWDVMSGLVNFETGINVTPVTPMARARNFSYYMRFGFNVSYSLGMNKPGFLDSYYNSLIFKIPVENCFEIFFNHLFVIGCGPQLQLDILYQKKLYDDPYVAATAAFSLYASVGYEYWFGEKKIVGMGLNNIFDFTFYKPVYIDYKVQLYNVVRFSIDKKKAEKKIENKSKEKNDLLDKPINEDDKNKANNDNEKKKID